MKKQCLLTCRLAPSLLGWFGVCGVERPRLILKVGFFALFVMVLISCGGNSMQMPSRALLSVSVQPANAQATAPTGSLPFVASGTFDQAPTSEDNLTAQWSSSDASIATIEANTGIATCVGVGGPITITASMGGKQGMAQLTCMASPQSGSGQCVYVCGSTRCGALTGYCSSSAGNACRQAYDPVHCPVGQPARATATNSCGVGIDTTRTCTP